MVAKASNRDELERHFERLDEARTFSDVESALDDFVCSAGFRYYLLRAVLRLQPGPGCNLRATNYPSAWLDHYADRGYNLIDPAALYARHKTRPALLHQLPGSCTSRLSSSFYDDVRGAGLYEGITIPLCTTGLWGFLNLNSPRESRSSEGAMGEALLFAAALVETLARVAADTGVGEAYGGLTRREREVLFWASSGKTAWETSEILGITERTVIAHLAKSMRTVGCVNKAQLIGAVASLLDSDLDLQRFRKSL